MRIGKLYLKIFISFIIILMVTEALIFSFFVIAFRSRVERYTLSKTQTARELIEDRIKAPSRLDLHSSDGLQAFVSDLARIYDARVWIDGPDGKPVAQSFSGPPPSFDEDFTGSHALRVDDVDLYRRRDGKQRQVWAIAPLDLGPGGAGKLNILYYRPQKERPPEGAFALGLIIIGAVIAVLIIPVSRFITNPLKRLKQSALELAEGDLSSRAAVKSKDEIGDLARSFNIMADKIEKMIQGHRELTANVSHELRSPLARIRIAEELIREKLSRSGDGLTLGELDDIREDIEELDTLIGKILDLSKLDFHNASMDIQEIDLSEITDDLASRFGTAAELKKLDIRNNIPPLFVVHADKAALRTALSNILDNAVKYTEETGRIILDASRREARTIVAVTNTCRELSNDELTGIFEPFYRLDLTRNKGSGLGLAIARRIAEKHGGTSGAENTDQGLKIIISLPEG